MPVEAELKFAVDPRFAAGVARHPALAGLARRASATTSVRSIYFDTADADLRALHLTLRLRRAGRRWWQTLKAAASDQGGLHVREESEQPLSSGQLDLEKIEDARLRDKLRRWTLAGALLPRFETVIRRRTWQLQTADGACVECALDRGQLRTIDGRRAASLCELELELVEGSPAALFALARDLAGSLPLAIEQRSKAERGYALWRREPSTAPVKAVAPDLPDRASGSAAAARVIGNGLAHLQRNWQAAAAAPRYQAEHVHQMRIAVRRLRTAFTTFGQVDPQLKSHPLVVELRWLAGLLGDARNWDVLVAETFPRLFAAFPDEPGLRPLLRQALMRRRAARAAAIQALHSPRCFSLALNLGELAVDVRENAVLSMPARPMAAAILARRYKQLRHKARNLTALSSQERHAMRIAAKKLRYSAEFFGSLFAQAKRERFLDHFRKLQNELGAMNDLATTRALISALGERSTGDHQRGLGLCKGWSVGVEQGRLPELRRCWKAVKRCAPFWPRHHPSLRIVTQ